MRSVALFLVLLASTSGCIRPGVFEAEAPEAPYQPIVEPVTEREVDVSDQTAAPESAPDVVVEAAPRPVFAQSEPVLFRLGAGYGALGQIDFTPCRGQGLDKGYLHMRVTFRHSGRVVHAVVERPAPPPDEALHCIAEQLQVAAVPVFDGEDVTLSKSYYVN